MGRIRFRTIFTPERVLVLAVFSIAILFRLWFIRLAPQPFWWDQEEYEMYARKLFDTPFFLAAHSYRSYPYPLLLAILYKFVGFGNHQAVYVMNAVIDAVTGVFVYLILKRASENKILPWAGMLVYAFNPFTSGYVGLVLTEVLETFFITGAVYAGLLFIRKPGIANGVLLGFLAGMAAENRNAAFGWAMVPILLTLIWVRWKKHKAAYAAIVAGLVLTVLHPLYTNWKYFGEISITKVDSFYAMEFYNGAVLKILPPFTRVYPPGHMEMWQEYWSEFHPGRTPAERKAIAAKYWKKGWEIVRADPADYLRWRFFKMWYVWQKENIFFITQPGYPKYRLLTYTGNLVLLLLAILGVVVGFFIKKTRDWRFVLGAVTGTFLYGTLAYSISHAEYRLTIPFYGIIIISAVTGVYALFRLTERSVSKLL